ncbi:LamG domain-containing protein [bacterium]|nr:LamG domain-containing protein [bacterium]
MSTGCFESELVIDEENIHAEQTSLSDPGPVVEPITVNSTFSFKDTNLLEGLVGGEVSVPLEEPSDIKSVSIWFADENNNIIEGSILAELSDIQTENIITLPSFEPPASGVRLVLKIETTDNQIIIKSLGEVVDLVPSDLEGMLMWVKSDQGLLDPSGDPVVEGARVATWQDQSGNGNDLVQTDASRRPTYHDTGALLNNDLPTLEFSGSWGGGNNMESVFSYSLPATFIVAGNFINIASGNHSLLGSGLDLKFFIDMNAGWMGPQATGQPDTSQDGWTAYALRWGNGVFRGVYGTSDFEHDYVVPGTPYSMLYLGSRGKAGWNVNKPVQYFNGAISEVIMYDRALTDGEMEILSNYLKARYAID